MVSIINLLIESQVYFIVSVTWNGTVITGPILIYHDEILLDNATVPTVGNSNDPGDLVCRSGHHEEARWHRSNGVTAPKYGDYQQVQSLARSLPSLSRLSTIDDLTSTDPQYNGLWVCVLRNNTVINEQDLIDNFVYVGIYSKYSGEFYASVTRVSYSSLIIIIISGLGAIHINNVSLLVNSFMADPPSFTLIGDTRGGPPVINTWTRNGEVISDGDSNSISLAVNEVNTFRLGNTVLFDGMILEESRYRSTLTVTGNLPGVYVYSVINRAMSAPRTASFTIEGIIIK